MKKSLVLLSAGAMAGLVALMPYLGKSNSTGAPAGYSGAPGENNCTSCHTGKSAISNSDKVTIRMYDGPLEVSTYAANKSYLVKINISDINANAFGFEATVKGTNNLGIGQVLLSPNTSDVKKPNGETVTHTNRNPTTLNNDEWEFIWESPSSGAGDITVYTAVNSVDRSNTEFGDQVHLKSRTFSFNSGTGITASANSFRVLQVFPNPVQSYVNLALALPEADRVGAQVFSLDGKLMLSQEPQNLGKGHQSLGMDLSSLQSGVYFLKLSGANGSTTQKIFKL